MNSTVSRRGVKRNNTERKTNSRRPTLVLNNQQNEIINEIEEEEISVDIDISKDGEDTFIRMNHIGDIPIDKVNKSQLVEYDAFYKEQFFKNSSNRFD